MNLIVFALPGSESVADQIAAALSVARGKLSVRNFPDGESYVRILSDCAGQGVAIVATLDRPNEKLLPLLFLAETVRELGAAKVGLVTPYLGYMRQDQRFNPGEALTSRSFATLLSSHFDWLVTVDPHLHRYQTLGELYTIPAMAVHSAPAMGEWIGKNVARPVIAGPDVESTQWVAEVAHAAASPYFVMTKERLGDREVRISSPDISQWTGRTPVLVDDIVSTARTMIEATKILRAKGLAKPICVGVHAIFADKAEEGLRQAGASSIVTCNTVSHATNKIDVTPLLADAVRTLVNRNGDS